MPVVTFKDIIHKGKCFFGGKVVPDMKLDKVLEMYGCAILDMHKQTELSSVNLKKLDIVDTCKLKYKNLLSEIINKLITSDISIEESIKTIQQAVNNFSKTLTNINDEKVKVNVDDPESGYLADKIITPQTGCITVANNKISFIGFSPIGAVTYIDAGRVGDFDNTGKGKSNTDVWGWAFSNGQNGTRNRFGKFPRFIDTLASASKTGGSSQVALGSQHLPSFEIPVTGTIADGLVGDRRVTLNFNTNKISDGAGGSTILLRLTAVGDGSQSMQSTVFNLAHTHTFNLKAKLDNPNVTKLDIVPEYIYEIPIQRINA